MKSARDKRRDVWLVVGWRLEVWRFGGLEVWRCGQLEVEDPICEVREKHSRLKWDATHPGC